MSYFLQQANNEIFRGCSFWLFPVLIRKESHYEKERLFVQPAFIKTIILRPFGILAPSSSCDIPEIKHYLSLKTNHQLASQLDPSGLFYIRTSSACAVRLNIFAINSTVMILPVL